MEFINQKELGELKYVTVELSLNSSKTTRILGLFVAIRKLVSKDTGLVRKDETFIWLQKGRHVHILNLDYYNFETLEVGYGPQESASNMRKWTKLNQQGTVDWLNTIVDSMKKHKRSGESGLINTSTYAGLPGALAKEVASDSLYKNAEKDSITAPATNNTATITTKATAGYTPIKKVKKVVSTYEIKRTTKYPISGAIEKMKIKVQQIRDGVYVAPELPTIPADKEEKEADAKKK